jgi:hypothetical protein
VPLAVEDEEQGGSDADGEPLSLRANLSAAAAAAASSSPYAHAPSRRRDSAAPPSPSLRRAPSLDRAAARTAAATAAAAATPAPSRSLRTPAAKSRGPTAHGGASPSTPKGDPLDAIKSMLKAVQVRSQHSKAAHVLLGLRRLV